jgi:hypothetical protein
MRPVSQNRTKIRSKFSYWWRTRFALPCRGAVSTRNDQRTPALTRDHRRHPRARRPDRTPPTTRITRRQTRQPHKTDYRGRNLIERGSPTRRDTPISIAACLVSRVSCRVSRSPRVSCLVPRYQTRTNPLPKLATNTRRMPRTTRTTRTARTTRTTNQNNTSYNSGVASTP